MVTGELRIVNVCCRPVSSPFTIYQSPFTIKKPSHHEDERVDCGLGLGRKDRFHASSHLPELVCRSWHPGRSVGRRRPTGSGCRGFIGPVPPPLWIRVRLYNYGLLRATIAGRTEGCQTERLACRVSGEHGYRCLEYKLMSNIMSPPDHPHP